MNGYQLAGKKRMTNNKTNNEENLITGESFEELFLKQSEKDEKLVGSVIKGTVLNIEKEIEAREQKFSIKGLFTEHKNVFLTYIYLFFGVFFAFLTFSMFFSHSIFDRFLACFFHDLGVDFDLIFDDF